jgi:hypothetical protein
MSVPGSAACAGAATASATISASRERARRNDGRGRGALARVHTVTDSPVSGHPIGGTHDARQTDGRTDDPARRAGVLGVPPAASNRAVRRFVSISRASDRRIVGSVPFNDPEGRP